MLLPRGSCSTGISSGHCWTGGTEISLDFVTVTVSSGWEKLFSYINNLRSDGSNEITRSPPHHSLGTLTELPQLGKFTSKLHL